MTDAPHDAATALLASYAQNPRTVAVGARFLPSRSRVIDLIEALRRLTFPGFFGTEPLAEDALEAVTRRRLGELDALLFEQVRHALRYALNRVGEGRGGRGDDCDDCDVEARAVTDAFIARIPEVRRLIGTDVQAAFDGDPATDHTDETVFCYPGIDAIFTHRYAHELCRLRVPMLPRIMSEVAHGETGIDIHPGATIGEGLFIDHGTGIVIGQTCEIGTGVKLYQGVTLGALSTKGGHDRWAGKKRHPTLEDGVTVYGGAIILGGNTVIGKDATVGGSVFLTRSVPPGHTVSMEAPSLKVSPPRVAPEEALRGFDWVI
ncbi:serine O-acetyltransferase [Phycisphaera mikurensis]|uniref:Serine acetyltransferase n=1 Tax=Phycisphaera mikurensis (strain NBRC 102666 / KCTC 22515 / FYK2301M01) TaxID=1142394 RepID=I0IF85_PHYMF|nr:serine acetyltransferase [Phycisphaera mikurensis]MBB6440681.1 serine O-acetyltransferase [Phycisphaera mikurensis]BAM03923.1 serine acetyltransferase [Phycisphaera mikurensis NBRC 102666]